MTFLSPTESSRARYAGVLSILAAFSLVLSACASQNSEAQNSSSQGASTSSSAVAGSSASASSEQDASASSSDSSTPGQESSDPSAEAREDANSSDKKKPDEIYTGAEDMSKASNVATDAEEVKKTTELVNSYESILNHVKPAPSDAPAPKQTSEPSNDEEAQKQNAEQARAVLDEETIHSIEKIAVDSAAAEFAVQASEYALAGWHYEGTSTVVGTPRMAETQYKGQSARLLEVCMDSSSVKISDEDNQPVKDDSSPKRSLNIYTLVQVDGQWKIASHDFPNNPDC